MTTLSHNQVTAVVNNSTFSVWTVVKTLKNSVDVAPTTPTAYNPSTLRLRFDGMSWSYTDRIDRPRFAVSVAVSGYGSRSTDYVGFATVEEAEAYAAPLLEAYNARRAEKQAQQDAAEAARNAAVKAAYERNAAALANATVVSTFAGRLHIFDYLDDEGQTQTMVGQVHIEHRPGVAHRNGELVDVVETVYEIWPNTSNVWGSRSEHSGSLSSCSTAHGATLEEAWGNALR